MAKRNNTDYDTHYDNLFSRNVNFRERIIYISDDIDEWSADVFQKAFDELDKEPSKPIRVEISSYGGAVYDMLGMVDRIKASPCHIITRGLGKIMSAATFILSAGDERIMGKNSWYMVHELSSWAVGKLKDLKIELKHLERLEDQCNNLYEEFSNRGVSAKKFEQMCKKDCYLTAKEVLELGLIDKIEGENE